MLHFSHFIFALLFGSIILGIFVSIQDYQHRRIPNQYLIWAISYVVLIFIGMAFFIPISLALRGFMMSVFGFLLGGIFLFPSYAAKQVAAGDVKLLMVYGLFFGPKGVVFTLLIGAMVGGVWALALACKTGGIAHMWYNIKFMARSVYLSGCKDMGWDLKSDGAIKMPYGVALSAGAAIVATDQLILKYQQIFAV